MEDLNIAVKDATEDIGIITERDPWEILSDIFGKKFIEYRRRWALASDFRLETDYPIQIDFELNDNCNLKCPSCTWSKERIKSAKLFPFKDFQRIVEEGVKKGLCSIDFSFVNEPLLRKDLPQFVKFARSAGIMDMAFNTNANLLTEKMGHELIDAGLTRLHFSLDALTADIYDKVRPGGNYDTVVKNIESFLEAKKKSGSRTPLTAVSFLKMSVNDFQYRDFIKRWRPAVDFLIIREYVSPYGNGSEFYEEKKGLFQKKRHIARNFKCNKPWQRLIIRADGTVLPCCIFYATRLPMGNIYSKSVDNIWMSRAMKKLRAIHKEGRYFDNKVCRMCAECSTGQV